MKSRISVWLRKWDIDSFNHLGCPPARNEDRLFPSLSVGECRRSSGPCAVIRARKVARIGPILLIRTLTVEHSNGIYRSHYFRTIELSLLHKAESWLLHYRLVQPLKSAHYPTAISGLQSPG